MNQRFIISLAVLFCLGLIGGLTPRHTSGLRLDARQLPGKLASVLRPEASAPEQYELGRRIGAFELAWEKNTDMNARRNALAFLRPTTLQMLITQFDEAGRAFDDAR